MAAFTEKELEYLRSQRLARIATLKNAVRLTFPKGALV